MQNHTVYILYTPPSSKALLFYQSLVLTTLSFTSKKKILGKERDRCLKPEEIAAAIALQAKSSIDRNNFEISDLVLTLQD